VVSRFVKAMDDAYCWYSKPANLDHLVTIMQHYAKVPELSDAQYKAMVTRILPSFGPAITSHTIDTWSKLLVEQKQLKAPMTRAEVIATPEQDSVACGD